MLKAADLADISVLFFFQLVLIFGNMMQIPYRTPRVFGDKFGDEFVTEFGDH